MSESKVAMEDLNISSSWIEESGNKKIENTITLDSSANKSVELEDVVQLNTCVRLIQKEDANNNEPCTVTLIVPESTPTIIHQLVIVSEDLGYMFLDEQARILELFGKHEEYLCSCTANYIDDFEDCAVYRADCDFKPTKKLLIKFQKTKHANNLWLYGIHIKVHPNTSSSPILSSIDYDSVNYMLREVKVPISDNAEKLKAFLQNYRGGPFNHNQQPFSKPPENLMKMLEAQYYNSIKDKERNNAKCVQNMFSSVPCSDGGASEGRTSDVLMLKSYFDKRFLDLEKRLEQFENKLVEIEKRQNSKLDCIISLLSK